MDHCLLITIDSLRADHVGYHGYDRNVSPNLDARAATGSRFMNAYSHVGGTRFSFPSILSGVTPMMFGGHDRISDEQTLISEVFKASGYRTAGIHSNLYVSGRFGYDRGWDLFFDSDPDESSVSKLRKWAKTTFDGRILDWLRTGYDYLESSQGLNVGSYHVPADEITDRAIEFVDEHPDATTFLWVHYMDVHHPFLPPEPYRSDYVEDPISDRESIKLRRKYIEQPEEITDDEHRTFLNLYDAEIKFTDAEIGRLLDYLDRVWGDDYMVAMTADHGDHFLEHGYFSGARLRHVKNHVPLFISGWEDTDSYDELVGLVDLPTTLLDVAGLDIPDTYQGTSLRRLVFEDEWPREDIIGGYIDSDGDEHVRVREDGWKLIEHSDSPNELYDLTTDPGESTNVIDDHPDIVNRLAARLDDHRELVAETGTEDVHRPQIEGEVRDRLRRLGYQE